MPGIATANESTVKNLLAAYEGESNASAKYTAFSAKADAEGYHGAASLFRACARAEAIHAANHARVIKALGGEASYTLHHIDVKGTLDNLKTALAGELYEVNTMYPEFLEEARAQGNRAAVRTFDDAMEAEKTHARLYSEAIALVEAAKKDSWAVAARDFYVCPVCGYTSESPDEHERCPVCSIKWERFEVIR